MTNLPTTLPKELTAKQWRANKGLFTKAVSDATGLGTALEKLEKVWAAVPWMVVDPHQATALAAPSGDVTTAMLDKLEPAGHTHQMLVDAVKHEAKAVETLAKATADKWGKNRLMPSSSVKYITQVHTSATALVTALNDLDDGWKAYRFTAQRGRVFRTDQNIVMTGIRGAVNDLRAAAQTAQANQNLTNYRKMARGLVPTVAALEKSSDPAHQALKAKLDTLAKNPFNPKTEDDAQSDQASAHIQQVIDTLQNVNI